MKIPNFLKVILSKAISLKGNINKDQVLSVVRDEAHSFARGVVTKYILIFSSVFFFIGLAVGVVCGLLIG